jgi:septal ring factor EnvC (AmiA/AmiB activator)
MVVLAALYSAVVAQTVVESAETGGNQIIVFGKLIGTPGSPEGIWIIAGLSASAALAMVSAVAYARGRRLERRMAEELDARWEEISQRDAGTAAQGQLVQWRIAELQSSLEDLIRRRDETLQEMEEMRARTQRLQEVARQQRDALTELTNSMSSPVVDLPEVDEDLLEANGSVEERIAQLQESARQPRSAEG